MCFALSAASLYAFEPEQNNMNDPKAKSILDKVSLTFKNKEGIYSRFSQTIEVPGGKNTSKEGELYLKGNKFKVQFPDQTIFCDEKSVWTYLKEDNEVQINDYEPDQSDITPSSMFNIYQSDFHYIQIADESISGTPCFVIDLTPKDKSRSYFKIRLWINKSTFFARRIKVFDKNGYRYTYTINHIDTKSKLSDTLFQFNRANFPGVKVEDLRM